MKRLIYLMTVVLLILYVVPVQAQKDDFDFDKATDFHLLWLSEELEEHFGITDRITQDLRINGDWRLFPNTGERFIEIWIGEPEYMPTFINIVNNEGVFDELSNYLNITSNNEGGWTGGGSFTFYPQSGSTNKVDFTGITNEHRFHMAVKKTAGTSCLITINGRPRADGNADPNSSAKFSVGVGVTDNAPNITPGFVLDEWYIIDMPVAELKALGWDNREPFKSYYFTWLFSNDDYDKNPPANVAFDAIFFYKKVNTGKSIPQVQPVPFNIFPNPFNNHISVSANIGDNIEIMDISGKLVYAAELSSGINEIPSSHFPSGIYFAKIRHRDNSIQFFKMLKL